MEDRVTRTSVRDVTRKALLDQYLEPDASQNMPGLTCLEERPQHVTMAYLLAAGRTRSEIAQVLGLNQAHISIIVRQPWFQKRLKAITEAAGKDMVKQFLDGEVLPSLETLRSIRDDGSQRGATRVAAANSILDRFMGKPVAHIESKTNLNIHTAADTVDQVQRELSSIDEQLQARGVSLSRNSNN